MCIKWSRSWELFYLNTPGAKPKRVICTVVISRFVEQSHVRGMRIGTIEKKSDPYWAGEDHGQWKNGNKSVSFASVLRNSRDLWTCFAVWYRCSSTWSMREWCFFPNFLGLKYIICSRYLESCFSRCLALSFWRVSRDLQTGFASCKIVSDRRGHGCFLRPADSSHVSWSPRAASEYMILLLLCSIYWFVYLLIFHLYVYSLSYCCETTFWLCLEGS